LTSTANQSGSGASYNSNLYSYLAEVVNLNMVAGHVLNHRLHGSGSDPKNITPISGRDNSLMESNFESKAFEAVFRNNAVLHYYVKFSYGGTLTSAAPETALLADRIRAKVYEKKFEGEDTPENRENASKWTGMGSVIYDGSWDLSVPTGSAGATVAEKYAALEAVIPSELHKNRQLQWRGSDRKPGFSRLPGIRPNYEGLPGPKQRDIENLFNSEKSAIKSSDRATLRAGFSDPNFLGNFSAFLANTALDSNEVATEIGDYLGMTLSASTVRGWARPGMSQRMQQALLVLSGKG
jgi:hypothetical protein